MATRYLQLQHPGRRGKTSGDGRSVWNGTWRHSGITWDISSCGTGVTRLCPATAETSRFYKTGSRTASYGCGTASVEEGLAAAVMSEALHRNGIPTERVLAVIAFPGGFAVNVRAAHNLLRPSHLFAPLKQNDLARLKSAVDYAIARQRKNGALGSSRTAAEGYRAFAEATAAAFGRAAAIFEREYVFCWLDWDGDNVLMDGAIVDYGSVRQFGLYHREYRFDDGPRWSTTIPEQRAKARGIVRCFAQIADALITGQARAARRVQARSPPRGVRRRVRRDQGPAPDPTHGIRPEHGEAPPGAGATAWCVASTAPIGGSRPLVRPVAACRCRTGSRGTRSSPRAICSASFRASTHAIRSRWHPRSSCPSPPRPTPRAPTGGRLR